VGFFKYAEEKSMVGFLGINVPLEAKPHAQAFSADVAVQAGVFLLSKTFGYAPEQPAWKRYFWTHFWAAPQFYVTVIFVVVGWILWRRGLRLHKYKNLTGRGHALTMASLLYGLFMAAFYVIEELTEPAIEGTGTDYTMHMRHWAIAGMGLSFIGVVIAFAGRGAPRLLMILLMIAFFGWWFFVEGLSHLTW